MKNIEDTLQSIAIEAAGEENSPADQDDTKNFWAEFGSMVGDLKNVVNNHPLPDAKESIEHDSVPLEIKKVPGSKNSVSLDIHPHVETYKIWVNWTTQRREQPGLHNDFFEIHSPWGTYTAIEELKTLINKKHRFEVWAVLSVFPVQ